MSVFIIIRNIKEESTKVFVCDIFVSEFELLTGNDVHFRTNTLWKSMKPVLTIAMNLNSIATLFLQGGYCHY